MAARWFGCELYRGPRSVRSGRRAAAVARWAGWCWSILLQGHVTLRTIRTEGRSDICSKWVSHDNSIKKIHITSSKSTKNAIFPDPPKIAGFTFPTDLVEGSSIQVLCGITSGDKPVYFSWLKDSQHIPSSLQVINSCNFNLHYWLNYKKKLMSD